MHPDARWRIRWMTAAQFCWSGPSTGHGRAIWDRDGEAGGRCSSRWPSHGRNCGTTCWLPLGLPRHPLLLARFGVDGDSPGAGAGGIALSTGRARAPCLPEWPRIPTLPLGSPLSAAIGLVLGIAAYAAAGRSRAAGRNGFPTHWQATCARWAARSRVASPVTALPDAAVVMCDVTPRQMLQLAGDRFPARFRRALGRYRYGPGAFKVDWALDGPIPWRARECARAGTVHLGGTLEEIAEWEASHTGRPFVLLVQHTLFDSSRAPEGRHTAWAYCHVGNGSRVDMTDAIEAQVERFAPGFRQRILGRHVFGPAAMESHNPNLVGGDFNGGALSLRQFFLRPTRRLYRTPLAGSTSAVRLHRPEEEFTACAVFTRPQELIKASDKFGHERSRRRIGRYAECAGQV